MYVLLFCLDVMLHINGYSTFTYSDRFYISTLLRRGSTNDIYGQSPSDIYALVPH